MRFKTVTEVSGLNGTFQVERRGSSENSRKNLQNTYTGLATRSSMRNLQRCTDVFFMRARPSHGLNPVTKKMGFFAAAFITLTIPDMSEIIDSHKGYNRFLKKFIQRLQYNFSVEGYIWRFEEQQRGQGHWHIFVDRFCPVDEVRRYWIEYLDEAGLTAEFRKRFDYEPSSACKIVGMRNEGMLRWYLNKYIVKKSQSENPTRGHLWGAAAFIKKMPLPQLPITLHFLDNVDAAEKKKAISVKDIEVEMKDKLGLRERDNNGDVKMLWLCTIIRGRNVSIIDLLCQQQRAIYDKFVTAYRIGDVKMANDLCWDEDDIRSQEREWSMRRAGGYEWWKKRQDEMKAARGGVSPPA